MNSNPPSWNSKIFNTSAFTGTIYLTRQDADKLYLTIAAGKNLGLIDGITSGIVMASKAVIVDSSNNIIGFNNIGTTSITIGGNTLTSTESFYLTSITAGTASASKALILNSLRNITNINSLTATQLTGTLQTAAQPNITSLGSLTGLSMLGSITMNGYNISGANAFSASGILTLSNTTAATNNSNGAIQMAGGLSISNTTDATSSLNGGSITTAGGLAIAKSIYIGSNCYTTNIGYFGAPTLNIAKVNINSLGAQLGLVYSSAAYATISSSTAQFQIALTNTAAIQATQTYSLYLDVPSQVAGATTTYPRMSLSNTFVLPAGNEHRLDMGDVPANFILQLYNPNTGSGRNASPSSGIGTANSAIVYTSSLINGHYFYSSYGLSGGGSNTSLGNYLGRITKDGNIEASNGLRAVGYNPIYSGSGAEIHYTDGIASFFGYDRTNLLFKTTQLGSSLFVNGINGFVSIGVNDASKAPLYVYGSSGSSFSGNFGYLNNVSAGGAVNFSNRQFSIRCSSGIFVESAEIDCASDIRFKHNVSKITDEQALRFVNKIDPIEFCYIGSEKKNYGYSAQDLMLNKYNVLVGAVQSDEDLDEQTLVNDDGESITIPKNTRLIVNMLASIPLLHKALKIANSKIQALEDQLNNLINK